VVRRDQGCVGSGVGSQIHLRNSALVGLEAVALQVGLTLLGSDTTEHETSRRGEVAPLTDEGIDGVAFRNAQLAAQGVHDVRRVVNDARGVGQGDVGRDRIANGAVRVEETALGGCPHSILEVGHVDRQ